jgi:predicted outer membrane repeat protein
MLSFSLLLLFGIIAANGNYAIAKDHTATKSSELTEALLDSQSNSQNNTIKVVAGTVYKGNFIFKPTTPSILKIVAYDNTFTYQSGDTGAAIFDGDSKGSVFIISGVSGGDYSLSGITFLNGAPTEYAGGGISADGSGFSLTIDKCVFKNNKSTGISGSGGALYAQNCHLKISNSEFTNNTSNTGGAIMTVNLLKSSIIHNNIFTGNWTDNYNGKSNCNGGAIYLNYKSSLDINGIIEVSNNKITSNKTNENIYNEYKNGANGGGLYVDKAYQLYLLNNVFEKNITNPDINVQGGNGGGAIIMNCALFNASGNKFIENETHGKYGGGAGLFSQYNTKSNVTDNTFKGNIAYGGEGNGGGLSSYLDANHQLTIQSNQFLNNRAESSKTEGNGGGIYIVGELEVQRGTFGFGVVDIIGNTISGNSSGKYDAACNSDGGGISIIGVDFVSLINNEIIGNIVKSNQPVTGGGAYFDSNTKNITILNNTIISNSAPKAGGFCADLSSANSMNVYNNIIYHNSAYYDSKAIYTNDIYLKNVKSNGSVFVSNNNYNNLYFQPEGAIFTMYDNTNIAPLFVDSANKNYHLNAGSSGCIDKGNKNTQILPDTDKDKMPRIVNYIVDMGAYEFNPSATACTATLNGDSLLHIPYLSYNNGAMTLWADIAYDFNPNYPTLIPFKLTNYEIMNNPSFSCAASTLSGDLAIHIPNVLFPDGITHLWVDLVFSQALSTNGNNYWTVSNYGAVSN